MAQYQHLPIYKTAYQLLATTTARTKNFPKDYKHTIGTQLREECTNLVMFIYKANSVNDRVSILTQIVERVQVVELLSRLCKDLNLISIKHFSEIVTLTDSLARQSQGWIKHSKILRTE